MTSIASNLAAPLKLTVAAGDHVHHLLHGVHPTAGAQVGALPDLLSLIMRSGVNSTGTTLDTFVAKLGV